MVMLWYSFILEGFLLLFTIIVITLCSIKLNQLENIINMCHEVNLEF